LKTALAASEISPHSPPQWKLQYVRNSLTPNCVSHNMWERSTICFLEPCNIVVPILHNSKHVSPYRNMWMGSYFRPEFTLILVLTKEIL